MSRRSEAPRLTQDGGTAFFAARELARWQGARAVDLPHLLFGAAQQPIGYCLLKRAGFDPQKLESLKGSKGGQSGSPDRVGITKRATEVVGSSKELASAWSHPWVSSGHVLVAAADSPTGWGKGYGDSIGVDSRSLRRVAESFPFIGENLDVPDLYAQLLELDWIDDETRTWLERKQIRHSIQNIEDLRTSVALLESSANGNGLTRYPDLGATLGGLTGDTFMTLECYEKAQADWPDRADTYLMGGALALAQRGAFEESRAIVGAVLERAPTPRFYVGAAQVEHLAGRVDQARMYLAKALSEIGQVSKTVRQSAEILWHSIDGGFEDALRATTDAEAKGPYSRLVRGLARVALAEASCLAGDAAADAELRGVVDEYDRLGMEGVVLRALVALAEGEHANSDERSGDTKERAVALATRLGRPVAVRRLTDT